MYYALMKKTWDDETGELQPIEKAYPFSWEGFEFIAHRHLKYNFSWTVTEPKTGRSIPLGTSNTVSTKKEAVERAIQSLENHKKEVLPELAKLQHKIT